MKVLVVEDELFSRKRVISLLKEVDFVSEVKECESGTAAIETIETYRPDLIFLDVNLQDMTGFDVLQQIDISPKPIVIFVTAYDNYAPKAFDFDAFDFLLKPFKNERFYKAMDKVSKISRKEANYDFDKRVQELIELHDSRNKTENNHSKKLPIKLGNKTMLIELNHINYVCASGYYAEIFTGDNKYVTRESLNNLIDILDPDHFFRVHRSTIVNLNFIQEIVHSDYAEIDVRMKDKKLIRVSKAHKKDFLKKLGLK